MTPSTLKQDDGPEPTVELFGKRYGQDVKLGMELGLPINVYLRWARLVAIRKDDCRPIQRYVIREYRPGDVDGIPTGGYHTTTRMWLVPRQQEA